MIYATAPLPTALLPHFTLSQSKKTPENTGLPTGF